MMSRAGRKAASVKDIIGGHGWTRMHTDKNQGLFLSVSIRVHPWPKSVSCETSYFMRIITVPCDGTGAEKLPLNVPRSLCSHKSRLATLLSAATSASGREDA